jgi:hypothetical protein
MSQIHPSRPLPSRLRRFQEAIGAGIDPTALVDVINEVHAQRAAARAELDGAPAPDDLTSAEVHAMIDSLGDHTPTPMPETSAPPSSSHTP